MGILGLLFVSFGISSIVYEMRSLLEEFLYYKKKVNDEEREKQNKEINENKKNEIENNERIEGIEIISVQNSNNKIK